MRARTLQTCTRRETQSGGRRLRRSIGRKIARETRSRVLARSDACKSGGRIVVVGAGDHAAAASCSEEYRKIQQLRWTSGAELPHLVSQPCRCSVGWSLGVSLSAILRWLQAATDAQRIGLSASPTPETVRHGVLDSPTGVPYRAFGLGPRDLKATLLQQSEGRTHLKRGGTRRGAPSKGWTLPSLESCRQFRVHSRRGRIAADIRRIPR